jgi:ubiquitin C-terminal hydrolase
MKEGTIYDCLKLFNEAEYISFSEGLRCDKCQVPTNHIRQISVSKLPPILIIQLKRFKIVNE